MARLGLAAEPRAGRGAAIPHRRGRAVRRARRAARNSASSTADDDGRNEAVRRGRVMISTQQIQERRRDELLRRQLLSAIADPKITDILVNEDGRAWFEAHGKGMFEAGFSVPASQVESLIGTVAAALGTVADADHPIVGGELQIERIR